MSGRYYFQLSEYLQMACSGMHSVKLNVLDNGSFLGAITIDGGELLNAEDKTGEGEEAFRRLILRKGTQIEPVNLDQSEKEKTIHISCEELIFRIFTNKDREHSLLSKSREPDTEPSPVESKINKGMSLLLGKNYRAAHILFNEVLEEDPGNEKVLQVLKRLRELL